MDIGHGTLTNLARLRDYRSRRLSSWDRSGGNHDFVHVPAGGCVVLGEIAGAGVVRHIWMTMASLAAERHSLRRTLVRMFRYGEGDSIGPIVGARLVSFWTDYVTAIVSNTSGRSRITALVARVITPAMLHKANTARSAIVGGGVGPSRRSR